MQQGVMEYHHSGVGTIVQTTWWVQCTHVHVVYGGKVIEILQVMGITVGGGRERSEDGAKGRMRWEGGGGEEKREEGKGRRKGEGGGVGKGRGRK